MNQMAVDAVIEKAKGTRGRKDAGQEAVIKMKPVEDRIADLVQLHMRAVEAKDKLNDAIKAVAEQSGLLAASVSKFVAARAGDKFEEAKTKATQLALIFDEIGEVKGSRGGTSG